MANKNNSGTPPTQEQLDITNAMAKAMQSLLGESKRLEASFISQAAAIKQMCEALECLQSPDTVSNLREIKNNLDQIARSAEGIRGVGSALSEASENAEEAASSTERLRDALNDTRKGSDKFGTATSKLAKLFKSGLGKAGIFATGALKGMANGFKLLFNVGRAGFGVFATLVKGIFSIGRALLAIPLTIFRKLTEMANKGATGISEWAQALNELKKEFGFLSDPTNSAILASARNVDKVYGKQAAFKLFGTPAERVKELAEIMKSAGPNLTFFSKDIAAGNVELLGLSRGLGLAGADFEAFAHRARTSGQELGDTMTSVAKYALNMSRKFNLNMKDVSRAMGKAAQDMTHFGNISEKQIAVAVTYAQKLGIQLDKITGSFDKFSTFDDAAENISKINEAFGTNLDIGEIMMEQDPAAQFEMIRKGLMGAGIQGEKMTFAQRKLLESTTGWDSATAIAALSTKNAGVALKDFQKEADKAEKKTMSHVEALKALTGAMHENLKAGNPTPGKGFFDKFLEGMKFALETHPAFMRLMQAFRKGFIDARQSGISFGTFLINNIPGIVKMMDGLAEIVGKIGILFNGVTGAVKKFVTNTNKNMGQFLQDISKNPKAAFEQLGGDLQKVFSDFFNVQAPGGRKLIEGFKDFMRFLIAIISGALPYIMDTMANIISKIADFITDPSKFMAAAKQKAMSGAGAGGGMLAPLIVAVTAAWPTLQNALDKLGKALFEKFEKLFAEYGPKIEKFFKEKVIDPLVNSATSQLFSGVGLAGMGIKLASTFGSIWQGMKIAQLAAGLQTVGTAAAGAGTAAAGAGAGFTAMLGPIAAVVAGIAALIAVYNEWSNAKKTIDADKNSAMAELAEVAKKGGKEALRSKLGINKKGIVTLSDDELKAMHTQYFGEVLYFSSSDKARIKAFIEEQYDVAQDLGKPGKRGPDPESVEMIKNIANERKKIIEEAQSTFNIDDDVVQQQHDNMLQYYDKAFPKMTQDQIKQLAEREADSVSEIGKGLTTARIEAIKVLESKHQGEQVSIEQLGGKGFNLSDQEKAVYRSFERLRKLRKAEIDKFQQPDSGPTPAAAAAEAAKKAQEEGDKMLKETMDSLGATTIDNVEERLNKIKEIGAKISGSKEQFKADMDKIRADLASMDFTLFTPEQATKFKEALGSLGMVKTFADGVSKMIASIDAMNSVIGGFGTSADPSSVAGKFLDGLGKLAKGMADVHAMFSGGNVAAGAETDGIASFLKTAAPKMVTGVDGATTALDSISDSLRTFGNQLEQKFTQATGNIDAQLAKSITNMSNVTTSFPNFATGLKNFVDAMNKVPEAVAQVAAANMDPAVEAVGRILDEARKLTTALESGGTIDIDASLKKFAGSAFQAKGGAKYTVSAKEVVLNVNFSVKMDADELQGVMAKRGVFKEKINWILNALPDASKDARETAPYQRI